ncbi:MAG: YIP1 family protein [Trueperaceae bacterium]
MIDAILQTFTKPVGLFRSMKDDDRISSRAFWVVALLAVLSGVYGYFSTLPQADALQGSSLGIFSNPLFGIVGGVVGVLLLWLIYGLIVRITAGMEAKPWAVTAYALGPQLPITAILIIVAALFPPQLTPITLDAGDPETIGPAMQGLQEEFGSSLLGRTNMVLTYVSSLWWIFLTFLGVRELAGQAKATRTAIVLGILTLLITAGPFLFGTRV